jgi:signal transduction histidine kinase
LLLLLLSLGKRVKERTHELVDEVYHGTQSAVTLLNDLLQYETIVSGTLKLDIKCIPLKASLNGKFKSLSFLSKKSQITLKILDEIKVSEYSTEDKVSKYLGDDYDSESLFLNVDIFRIDQVIRHLTSNALKFTPPGKSVTVKFHLTTEKPTEISETIYDIDIPDSNLRFKHVGFFKVEVSDSGDGIAPENYDKVKSQFIDYNRNELQGGGGSGLSLWICRYIVDVHSGSIGIHSSLNIYQ